MHGIKTRQDAFQAVQDIASRGLLSRDELVAYYDARVKDIPKDDITATKSDRLSYFHPTLVDVMYYVGAGIIILGMSIFVGRNWVLLDNVTRLLVTLGLGMTAYFAGMYLVRRSSIIAVGLMMYVIAAYGMGVGLLVLIHTLGGGINAVSLTLCCALLGVVFLMTYTIARYSLVMLLSIGFMSAAYICFSSYIVEQSTLNERWEYWVGQMVVLGISYLLLAYGWRQNNLKNLSPFLYVVGSALVLTAWYALQWSGVEVLFVLTMPLLVAAVLYMSVILRRLGLLILGALYTMLYVLGITWRYFSSSISWPLALMVCGFVIIAIGYLVFVLKRKYISHQS